MNAMSRLLGGLRRALFALALLPGMAGAQPVQEHLIKTAFLYNFVLFTDWPTEVMAKSDSINVCFDAGQDMREALMALNDKSAKGKRLKLIFKGAQDRNLAQCHVLYVEAANRSRWPAIRKAAVENQVLTVADDADTGTMVTLSLVDSKIVFDIDQNQARQARLTFSSKLLRLARTVK